MNIFLWIVQAVLAVMFAMAGVMKTTQPKDKLVEKLPWVADFSAGTVQPLKNPKDTRRQDLHPPSSSSPGGMHTPFRNKDQQRRKEERHLLSQRRPSLVPARGRYSQPIQPSKPSSSTTSSRWRTLSSPWSGSPRSGTPAICR